ncbi:putative gustatory receptor 57a [Drosophila sulfurigaster albostrigata]|uniref:putative gustatory receptor 57a n=1 Tax=Drosophila sulfurigaster albostrigata TaxID=89887 RepID=UPI002D218F6B|nr:putative gustatory receptor 57a [Drosophila sulfurigaster albostrigata]
MKQLVDQFLLSFLLINCISNVPLKDITIEATFFKKDNTNQFKPFMFPFNFSVCHQDMKYQLIPFSDLVIEHLRTYTNVNHSCPYMGHMFARQLMTDEARTEEHVSLSINCLKMVAVRWEPGSLHESVSLTTMGQFVVCCSGFFPRGGEFVINKWTRLYSVCCASLAVLGLCGCLYAIGLNDELRSRVLQLDKLVLSIMGMELVISSLVFILTVLSLQLGARQHLGIYERLAEIDRRLMRDFGANLNYRKLSRKNIIVLSVVGVLYISAVNTALARGAAGHQLEVVVPAALCYILITSGPHLTGYVHMSLTELLSIRFRLLQQILQPQFLYKRFGKGPLVERRLRSLVDIVKELHYIILQINEVYNVSLWSAMAHDFTLSTSELYIIFARSDNSSNDAGGVSLMLLGFLCVCMLVPFYKMLIAPVYCSRSVDEGRRCLRLLEQLDDWFPHSAPAKQLVEAMMRWRWQFKVEFTSGTSITLNKTVITLFASIVCNYLLVLIQFAMTQKLGEQVEQQKVALQEWIGI